MSTTVAVRPGQHPIADLDRLDRLLPLRRRDKRPGDETRRRLGRVLAAGRRSALLLLLLRADVPSRSARIGAGGTAASSRRRAAVRLRSGGGSSSGLTTRELLLPVRLRHVGRLVLRAETSFEFADEFLRISKSTREVDERFQSVEAEQDRCNCRWIEAEPFEEIGDLVGKLVTESFEHLRDSFASQTRDRPRRSAGDESRHRRRGNLRHRVIENSPAEALDLAPKLPESRRIGVNKRITTRILVSIRPVDEARRVELKEPAERRVVGARLVVVETDLGIVDLTGVAERIADSRLREHVALGVTDDRFTEGRVVVTLDDDSGGVRDRVDRSEVVPVAEEASCGRVDGDRAIVSIGSMDVVRDEVARRIERLRAGQD